MPVVLVHRSSLAVLVLRCGGIGAANGFVDILGSAVIGGDDEIPVAENLVEVFQIACSGIRRLHGVAAFVYQRVHLQAILFTRTNHKLPQSRCSHAAYGLGVQC